jgi:uncharacterized membrane protein YqjE
MDGEDHQTPGLATLLGRIGRTGLGALRNRAELLSVEWQEEKARLSNLLILSVGLMFLSVLTLGLVLATIILLVPAAYRAWAMGGLAVLCGAGALLAWLSIKKLLQKEPFSESLEQVRKDSLWQETTE